MGGWVWKLAVQCWQFSPQTHVLYLKWLFISLHACVPACLHVCTSVCENRASATFGDSHHRRHMSCNGFLSDSMPIYLCMSARLNVKMALTIDRHMSCNGFYQPACLHVCMWKWGVDDFWLETQTISLYQTVCLCCIPRYTMENNTTPKWIPQHAIKNNTMPSCRLPRKTIPQLTVQQWNTIPRQIA